MLKEIPPCILQIFQNLPLYRYLHVLKEISPCSLQIFQNLPLDRYLGYLHVLADNYPLQFADFPEIYHWTVTSVTYMCLQKFPTPSLQIFQNLPLDRYIHVLAEIPPLGADVLKSATGELPKLPTCVCRNYPPFANFPKSVTGHIVTCACRNSPPPVCRFSKICHLTDTYMCLQKFPPGVQIFQNLPLDSYLSYLHVFAEITHYFQIFQNLLLDI